MEAFLLQQTVSRWKSIQGVDTCDRLSPLNFCASLTKFTMASAILYKERRHHVLRRSEGCVLSNPNRYRDHIFICLEGKSILGQNMPCSFDSTPGLHHGGHAHFD